MAAQTAETEIKLRIGHPRHARTLLESHGFQISVPEVFERNVVLDDASSSIRGRGCLLRLRQAGETATITFKGVATSGKHKEREERETTVAHFDQMLVILERLGFRQTFLYEKYRTEYRLPQGGVVTVDETPAGNFLEIEGDPAWIDATAQLLGFTEADYLTLSYGKIYAEWCEQQGVAPGNMTFTLPRSVPDPLPSPR